MSQGKGGGGGAGDRDFRNWNKNGFPYLQASKRNGCGGSAAGPVVIMARKRVGAKKWSSVLFFLSVLCSKPFLESMWNVIALLTSIFSLPRSEEELHWLIIAGMKGTLTLSAECLACVQCCPLCWRQATPGERLESVGELLSGQPASKGFIIRTSVMAKQPG